MGKRDYPAANCVRALFGESPSEESADEIIELRCNIDDMTGEEIGFAFDKLLNAGAADVYTVPTGMKKNRPGIMLCVLCNAENAAKLSAYCSNTQALSASASAECRDTFCSVKRKPPNLRTVRFA